MDMHSILERVRGEFNEMPCMRVTLPQARALFGLRGRLVEGVLNRLITEESPARRFDELLAKARETELDDAEKQELQSLLQARGQVGRKGRNAQ